MQQQFKLVYNVEKHRKIAWMEPIFCKYSAFKHIY